MKISISTDSTSDLPESLVKEHNIHVMPLIVILGEESYSDGVDIEQNALFEYVEKTGNLPKTAARSIQEYEEFFDKCMKEDGSEAHIHISLSSELSSTNNYATIASQNLKNVYVIDSRSLSSGSGLLVLSCVDKIKQGLSPEEIVAQINEQTSLVQASFVVDKLNYLHKGGRCSALTLLGANILGIRPSIKVAEGKMGVDKKYMGKFDSVVIKYVNETLKNNPNAIKDRIFITYTTAKEELVAEIEQILTAQGFKNIYKQVAGCTITSHCGKNTLGILFINEK